jgi:sugar phosphate isomerase/epimerase
LLVSNFVILRGTCLEDEATRRRNISDIIQAIRAAAACGIPLLNLTSGGTTTTRVINADDWFRPAIEDTQAAWDRFTASLEMLLPEAERHGVTLALEPCVGNLVHDYGTTLEMLRRVDHPNLCLTFDPSHFMLFRDDIPLAVSTFGNRVRHVHLKDAVGRLGEISKEFIFPLLGEGGIDFPTFLAALDAIGYQGFYSVEFESFKFMNDVLGNDPARAAELSHMAASAILARARA